MTSPLSALNPRPKTHRNATIKDASAICHVGSNSYRATFDFWMSGEDIDQYLNQAYSIDAISNDISHPNKHSSVAYNVSEPSELLGFAQLVEGTTEPFLEFLRVECVEDDGKDRSLIELQRLYIVPEAQGMGIANRLLLEMEKRAKEMAYMNVWLGVGRAGEL